MSVLWRMGTQYLAWAAQYYYFMSWYYFIVCSFCWQWNRISSYTLPGGAYILCHLWNRVDFKHSIHKENELLTKSLFVLRFQISAESQWKTCYFCSWVSYVLRNITSDLALQIKWTNTPAKQSNLSDSSILYRPLMAF